MIQSDSLNKGELQELITALVEEVLRQRLVEFVVEHEKKVKEFSVVERLLRLEEELKAMRELEERRFEALLNEMNTRFESTNTRFESLEKRLGFLQWFMAGGFTSLAPLISIVKIFG